MLRPIVSFVIFNLVLVGCYFLLTHLPVTVLNIVLWVLLGIILFGSLISLCSLPMHWLHEAKSKRLQDQLGASYPKTLLCPISGRQTDSLKQMVLPTRLFFFFIGATVSSSEVVASPTEMRKKIVNVFLGNLILGNLLTLMMMPQFLTLYMLTYNPGHSARLYEQKVGAIRKWTC